MKTLFSFIFFLCLLPLFSHAQELSKGRFELEGRRFFYELTEGEQGLQWKLREIKNERAQIVYVTRVSLTGKPLQKIVIFGARKDTYGWAIGGQDYFKAQFEAGKVTYSQKGSRLQNSSLQTPKTQQDTAQSRQARLLQTFKHFTALYLLSNSETSSGKIPELSEERGKVQTAQGAFTYTFEPNLYRENDHRITIRYAQGGLAYQSLIRWPSTDEVRVFYAKPQNFSWKIYGSEYLQFTFSEKKMNCKKEGLLIPKPASKAPSEIELPVSTLANAQRLRLVVEYVLNNYPHLLLSHD